MADDERETPSIAPPSLPWRRRRADRPEQAGQPDQPDQAGQPDQPDQAGQPEPTRPIEPVVPTERAPQPDAVEMQTWDDVLDAPAAEQTTPEVSSWSDPTPTDDPFDRFYSAPEPAERAPRRQRATRPTKAAKPPREPRSTRSAAPAKAPKPPRAPREPRPTRPARAARTAPIASVPPRAAAAAVGALVGLLLTGLTVGALRGCGAVRGTETCGGAAGTLLLVLIVVVGALLGRLALDLLRAPEPGGTAVLGVALVCVVSLLFLAGSLTSPWMVVVQPILGALAFLGAQLASTAFEES
ncbi:hypothetical protein K8Z61_17610 [Nocardioides sp. TRM66260-LWL]|uniref:hypothetical protein n=1 Tax=Nocardioides sp. TRM66260-LWL TaxID=2874478 RepID=UPI001CC379BF|nr:hypothetical protein [Nocardioides sp. TRM66260-LWL]MBZ5736312.1 hypothetical protein [Nocardioides sp. TRM66260-LWL]